MSFLTLYIINKYVKNISITKQEVYQIYQILSPYIQIAFTALLAYYSFIKQFLVQRTAERRDRIQNQKDSLIKEVFDHIHKKVEDSYSSLSSLKGYSILLKNHAIPNRSIFILHCNSFLGKYFDLHENLHSLFLSCEKYDFLMDPHKEIMSDLLDAESEIHNIYSDIQKTITELLDNFKNKIEPTKETEEALTEQLETLSKVCSQVNATIQKTSERSKKLLKDILNSLDKQIKSSTLAKH